MATPTSPLAPGKQHLLPQRTLFSLHGIQTTAGWQRILADLALDNQWRFRMGRWSTGIITVIDLLLPWRREAKIKWFLETYRQEMRELRLDPSGTHLPSIIVHSFGSYILGAALIRDETIRFNHVIICGSILPRSFPWDVIIKRGQVQLVRNEYGTKDFWGRIVGWFVRGAGSSGVNGFTKKHSRLRQACFPGFAHSDYFTREHMTQYWMPFLQENIKHLALNRTVPLAESDVNFPIGYYMMGIATVCGVVLCIMLSLPETKMAARAELTLLTNSPVSLEPVRNNLEQELLQAQKTDGGVWVSLSNHDEQVWTTAQTLKALTGTATAEKQAERIRSGLFFIEANRHEIPKEAESGWGIDSGATHTVTEINAWVQLAYLGSLRVSGVWKPSERAAVVSRIKERLAELTSRQTSNGGWSPVVVADGKYARTYSTMMAVWAISEALRNPETYDESLIPHLQSGVEWLLSHRTADGWIPDPAYVAMRAPGLDAECFYILSRVSQLNGFQVIRSDPAMLRARKTIIADELVSTASLSNDFHMDGSEQDLQTVQFPEGADRFHLEGSSFLWPAWYLTAYSAVEGDSSASISQRLRAQAQRRLLERRYSKEENTIGTEEWAFAETLIGLNETHNGSRNAKGD